MSEKKISFGIIGGGWRARHFLRIAREMLQRFEAACMFLRDAEKGDVIEDQWGIKTYQDLDKMLDSHELLFVVVCIKGAGSAEPFIKSLVEHDMPILMETPAGHNLEELIEFNALVEQDAKIQVAEQYQFHPLLAAQIAIAESGRLGNIFEAQVSVAHGFHGISLIRKMLGVKFENATINARKFVWPTFSGPGRKGPPTEEVIVNTSQIIAQFDFGNKLGIFDFDDAQYSHWIRGVHVLIRGEKGEICDSMVRYMEDYRTPIEAMLKRCDAGQGGSIFEGFGHKGILMGNEWIYKNSFGPVKLSDDELAIATCMAKMGDYAAGGPSFYSYAEAAQDSYLSQKMIEATNSSEVVTTEKQPWTT